MSHELLTASITRLKSLTFCAVAPTHAPERWRRTLSTTLGTTLVAVVVAGMLWAVPQPVARASNDDASTPILIAPGLAELSPELEASARKMQNRMRTVKHIVGASPDCGDVDLALVFAEEYNNPMFSIELGVQEAQVMGQHVVIDVIKVEDGRLHLEQALLDSEMAAYHEDFAHVLSTDSSIQLIDFIATGLSGDSFSSRTLRWTVPQWERPACLSLTSPDAPGCGVSIPFDVILPRDYYDSFPTFDGLMPPSWSFKHFLQIVRDPHGLDEVIDQRAHEFPVPCVLCPDGTGGFCWDEFLKGTSAASVARARYDVCVGKALESLALALLWKGTAASVVASLCFGVAIQQVGGVWKINFPKGVRIPKTWPVLVACLASLGLIGALIWNDIEMFQARLVLCLAAFQAEMHKLFDEACAVGEGAP